MIIVWIVREGDLLVRYSDTKDLEADQLERLFLSAGWSSGKYPDRLVSAMRNSGAVFTAWDGDRLIGLINVLDDGIMTAYVHYLLVDPEYQGRGIGKRLVGMVTERYGDYLKIVLISYDEGNGFYERCGFSKIDGSSPMYLTKLPD